MALSSDSLFARGFAADTRTWRALREGLSGRTAKVQRGRLKVALKALASEPASRLVFVDLDGISEPDVAARELAAVCAFETAVIAIGSTDTALYTRQLFQNGVADYLVKPISAALVREACATLSDEQPERPYAGRVIALSGSAGCGTSTLVAAMARAIAADGRAVSVVDLDPVWGQLASRLGVEPADGLPALLAALDADTQPASDSSTLQERIDDLCVQADAGLSLVAYASTATPPPAPSVSSVRALLGHLANRTHLVLVTGFPDPDIQLAIMQHSDVRALLYEPTLPSLSAAVRGLALLGTSHPATLVQSCSRTPRGALSSAHIRFALSDRRPDVVIPFDRGLHAATIGEKFRRPGRAYCSAVRKVMDFVMESAAVATLD